MRCSKTLWKLFDILSVSLLIIYDRKLWEYFVDEKTTFSTSIGTKMKSRFLRFYSLSWFPRNALWKFNCSENECRKQDHIFKHMSWKPNIYPKHCWISLKGVYSWFFTTMCLFSLISIKVINCYSHVNIKRYETVLSPAMLEKIFEKKFWKWTLFHLFIYKTSLFRPQND